METVIFIGGPRNGEEAKMDTSPRAIPHPLSETNRFYYGVYKHRGIANDGKIKMQWKDLPKPPP